MITAVYYVDCGSPQYGELAKLSIYSSHKAGNTVYHATDSETEAIPCDGLIRLPSKVTEPELVAKKALLTAFLGSEMKEPWALADADVIHRKPLGELLSNHWDIGLMWRDRAGMRINAGLIIGKPGFDTFWRTHLANVTNLTGDIQSSWWTEQLSLGMMVGTDHRIGDVVTAHGARVKLLDMNAIFPKEPSESAYAVHFKGARKLRMAEYGMGALC